MSLIVSKHAHALVQASKTLRSPQNLMPKKWYEVARAGAHRIEADACGAALIWRQRRERKRRARGRVGQNKGVR